KPGGICVQWEPTERTLASFLAVFPYVVELVGPTVLLGSDQPIPFDVNTLAARWHDPWIRSYLETAKLDKGLDEIEDHLRKTEVKRWGPTDPRPADWNSDLFPKDEFFLNGAKITAFQ